MVRLLSYILSLLFLAGFFWFDYRYDYFDAAIPYFGAVLFVLWSPVRADILIVSVLCLIVTLIGGYQAVGDDQTFSDALEKIIVERSLSIFALVCVAYVGWQKRGMSLRLQQMNQMLEEKVDVSEKEANAFQLQLNKISSTLDKHTVERRKSEQEFRETIASYQTLLESLPINVFQKNRKTQLIFGNKRYFETLGKSKDECIGKTDFDLFPKELAEKYHADDLRVIEQGKSLELIEDHLMPDGKKIYVQVFKAPMRNTRNQIMGLQGMFWDVTDRFRAEQSQKDADARFRSLVDSNIIGIFTGQADGEIIEANDEFISLLGYTSDDVANGGLRWDELTPPEFSAIDEMMEEEIARRGYCRPLEKEYFHKSGRRIPVLVGAVRLDAKKKVAICSVVDISRQKQAEQALLAAKEAADEANRSKSLFLANMSHEIRTPLNAIIGMTDLVLKSSLTRQQREYLKMVNDSGEALLEVISDILDFSKLQAGKMKLEPTEFSLRDKIGELLRPLSIRAYEKSLKLVCDIAGDVPDSLFGDPVCLRQVISNLLSNAIKFTDDGEIVLTVTVSQREDEEFMLHVSVTDTGTGISPEIQRKIFREFEQADNTSTRKYGGTGLGLAICSNLVELMKGEIWVESELGAGSTFHFTSLWKSIGKSGGLSKPIPESFHATRILAIDEHRRNLEVLRKILCRWDLSVETFVDPKQGLMDLERNPEGYQILMVDEQSADHDARFSSINFASDYPNLEVIWLRSAIDKDEEDHASDPTRPGHYLLKPVQESELFDLLAEMLTGEGFSPPAVEETEPTLPSLKILLAEDNLVNQKLATAILSQRNHDVRIACDGAEAIEMAMQNEFDLILMDIQMPEVDGIEATETIRAREKELDRHTVIIALTAHAGESDRSRCLAAGMDGYVTKPIRPFELMLEVKTLLSERIDLSNSASREGAADESAEVQSEQVAAADVSSESESDSTASEDYGPVVDWDEALKQSGNDPELLKDLVEIFESESPGVLSEIEQAIKAGDRRKLREKTHHLKGSFRVFACKTALEVSKELELLDENDSPDELFDELKREYDRVFSELVAFRLQGTE